jgi:hypothetical protein
MALTFINIIKLTNELLHRIFILPSYSGHSLHRQSGKQRTRFEVHWGCEDVKMTCWHFTILSRSPLKKKRMQLAKSCFPHCDNMVLVPPPLRFSQVFSNHMVDTSKSVSPNLNKTFDRYKSASVISLRFQLLLRPLYSKRQ